MALQSSGQISISDIKTELGSSSGSLTTLSTTAGKSAPHAISEFYGYTHSSWSNDYALDYDGVNDYVRGSLSSHPSQKFSISMWVRNDESSTWLCTVRCIQRTMPPTVGFYGFTMPVLTV